MPLLSPTISASVDEGLIQKTPLGECIQLPVDYFLEHVLPPLHPQMDPRKMVDILKTRGNKSRRAITTHGRWRGFARNPAESLRDESHVFKYLADVVQAIAKVAGVDDADPTVRFQNNPHGGSDYDLRDDNSLPDAYLHLHNTLNDTVNWMDIAVPGEYRKVSSHVDLQCVSFRINLLSLQPDLNLNQNVRNISWSICTSLRKDPRRRFTYGYSIEDTDMRLWYCDRYRIVTAVPFNFMFVSSSITSFGDQSHSSRNTNLSFVSSPL